MVGELFLAMDVGTSSVKSAAIDAQGKTIAETTCTYPTHRPQPGWAEQDPRDWTRSLTHSLKAQSWVESSRILLGVHFLGMVPRLY
jgi:xylulokinase